MSAAIDLLTSKRDAYLISKKKTDKLNAEYQAQKDLFINFLGESQLKTVSTESTIVTVSSRTVLLVRDKNKFVKFARRKN